MDQKLLIETLGAEEAGIITESSNDGKNCWLSGIYMQADISNRNGRNYPLTELTKAVTGAQKTIKEAGGIFGELDHPTTLTINLDRISHVITEMNMVGNNAMGKAKLLGTPMGSIAAELVKSGVKIGVSSRGAGAVNESGGVSDFNFVTVDLVATPSAPGAMPEAVYESLMMDSKGRKAVTLAETVQHDPEAQAFFKKAILDFVNQGLFAKK
jgi:hypothetical protein